MMNTRKILHLFVVINLLLGSTFTPALARGSQGLKYAQNGGEQLRGQIAAPQAPTATTYYVDADATGAATGLTWTDAYTNVQDALFVVILDDEIWVAEGVYYPDEGTGQVDDDPDATFELVAGVALYGGFEGTETSLDQRDWETYVTVLSGDLEQNDITDPSGVVTDTENITGSNAYHVVSSSGVAATAILDGFSITAGWANDSTYNPCTDGCGGGLYNLSGSPSLINLIFSGNLAAQYGGGIYNYEYSDPTLTNVTFSDNSARSGGGMYDDIYSSPLLMNVTFLGNSAVGGVGGGMVNRFGSNPTLKNVIFSGNSAFRGGGMFNDVNDPELINVTFSDNSASDRGGGMFNIANSYPRLSNIIFWGNTAGISGNQIFNDNSIPEIWYCDIQGSGGSGTGWDFSLGYDYGGNIDADPLFVRNPDPGNNDYGNLHLQAGSPAIDTGISLSYICPPTDLEGIPRPQGAGCDMGAYEFAGISVLKSVDDSDPMPGQTITFTIQMSNDTTATLTGGLISDTLPTGLNFLGPIVLAPPPSGIVGTAPPILVSDLTVPPGQQITITFPVSVAYGLPAGTQITNTAILTATELDTSITGQVVLTITNAPPGVDAGPNQTADEGELVQFQGAASDPGLRLPSSVVGLHWDFGDGTTITGTLTPTHTYLDDAPPATGGAYTVTLTVTDTYGASASDWLRVTVANVAPSLSPLPDQAAAVGEAITVTATITDPGVLDSQTVVITWADGFTETLQLSADQREFAATHTYTTEGNYTVLVTVTDKDGGWDQRSFTATITQPGARIYLPLVAR